MEIGKFTGIFRQVGLGIGIILSPNMKLKSTSVLAKAALLLALSACFALTLPASAQDAPASATAITPKTTDESPKEPSDEEKAWKTAFKASRPPAPPAEWMTNQPSREDQIKFFTPKLIAGADLLRDFYVKYPASTNAPRAHSIEYDLLNILQQQFGDFSQSNRIAALDVAAAANPNASKEEKMRIRIKAVKGLLAKLPDSAEEVEKNGQDLLKDFPDSDVGYQVLLVLLEESTGERAARLAKELSAESVPKAMREQAAAVVKKIEMVGKPVDIKFTALDGRQVDVSAMKGKVVLVDFWATWCGPCMAELPNVKEAYSKLHDKGLEIVGISFDSDKEKLQKTLIVKEMTWVQYFDGEGWGNKFGKEFDIHSIPTMWLVNKKGELADVNARDGLEEKIAKMLAE